MKSLSSILTTITTDVIVSASSALIIMSFSVILYADFNRKIEAGNAKQIGTVTFKKEIAQRKYQRQVVWEEVDQNNPVYNNDSIRTSGSSEAVIHLFDGTDINVDENSMIMLSTLENSININFEHGSISANRSGVAGKDITAINIKSQDATVSIDKSNIQLTQLENKELDVTVSDGTAKIKSGKEETLVKSNEKALISSDRKETRIVQLKFDMNEPAVNKYYIIDSQKGDIPFQWGMTGNFKGVTLDISSDRMFAKILASKKFTDQGESKISLSPGTYYWRLSAINDETRKAEFSETRKFSIIFRKPVKLISPRINEHIKHSISQNSVSFKWSDDGIASDYTLEIASDDKFTSVVSKLNTSLKDITVDKLLPGQYYWRISSNITIGGEKIVKTDPAIPFRIEMAAELRPPQLASPGKGEVLDFLAARNKGIILSWNNDRTYSRYTVEVSRDSEFTRVVYNEVKTTNFAEYKKDITQGHYFWRVQGYAGGEKASKYSLTGEFDVAVKETLGLITPSESSTVKVPSDARKLEVRFTWKTYDPAGSYLVQLSSTRDFQEIAASASSKSNSTVIPLNSAGQYFWRVIQVDKNNREIIRSNTGKVTVEREAPPAKTMLLVKSPVQGAKIFINSIFSGYTTVNKEVKADENITVKIVAATFADFIVTVKTKRGETTVINPALEKSRKLERIKWVSTLASPASASPIFYKDRIITCTENGTFVVMDASGHIILSKRITKRFDSKLLVLDNNVYMVDVNGILYSIDIATGNVNWQVSTAGPLLFKSEPAAANGRIFIATGYGVVEAYDLKGKKLWIKNLDESIYNSIQMVKDYLLVATDAMKFYALDSKDGDKEWSIPIEERIITLMPLVHNNFIYFGCYSGKFYAIDVKKGEGRWNFSAGGAIYANPIVVENRIYFGSEDGYVYCLDDKNGKMLWQFKTSGAVKYGPVSAFGNIIVVDEMTVYALNPLDGAQVWQNTFQSRIKTSPGILSDGVALGLANGQIVSVRNSLIELVR